MSMPTAGSAAVGPSAANNLAHEIEENVEYDHQLEHEKDAVRAEERSLAENAVPLNEKHTDSSPATLGGSAPSGGEKRSFSDDSGSVGNDDKIPTPRQQTPPPEPKKRGGLFKKKAKKEGEVKDASDLVKPVGLISLFRFATKTELILNFIGIILACASGAAQPLMTLIFGRLSNTFTEFTKIVYGIQAGGGNQAALADRLAEAKRMVRHEAGLDALYLLAIGLGMFVCIYIYMIIWNYTSECQGRRIRERYLRSVLRQDIAYFDDLGAGEVATRIQTDCHLVQQAISEKIPIALSFLATFITGFVLAYIRLPRLAGAMTSILPVIMIAGSIMAIAMTKFTTKSLQYVSKSGTIAEEAISSIRTVKAFGTGHVLAQTYDKNVQLSRNAGIKGAMIEGSGLSVMFFAIYSAYALAFFYGGILVSQGKANVGQVINAFMSILIGSFSMAMFAPEIQTVTKGQAAAAKLWETMDRIPAIDSADPSGLKPDTVHGHIELENVKFHYPSRPNVPILKGLNTDFKAGHTIALVGASGSGKSTVIQLIERFYDPLSGCVKLDGVDIRSLNLKWLRQQIGLVSQEPVLFATTVRGNIEHGLIGSKWEHASDDERYHLVKQAAINANADGFISKLPEGYDTIVGERGMLLSGGQKQRVAIARAIVSDPRILLLDEATSALDGLSERVVQDALDKASVGRTTIVVAHRLATIKNADQILVMGGGEILEQGTHNSLLENPDGAYAQLVANQKLSQAAAENASDDVEVLDDDEIIAVPGSPSSPLKEKSGFNLRRSVTGRSVASALLEQQRLQREAKEKTEGKISFMTLFFRLLKLNGAHWKWYSLGTVGAIASGMVYPALSILFGKAMGDFALPNDQIKDALRVKAQWYFIVAIIAAICIWFQQAGYSRTGWEMVTRLRSVSFKSVLKHDVEWFDEEEHATGAITSNLSDHPQKVQGLFGVTLGTIIQSLSTLIGGMIIGLCYAPLLALVGIACIPLVISSGFIRLKVVVLKDQKVKKWYSASAQLASEATGSVRTVASLTREEDIDRIYSESLQTPFNISTRSAYTSQLLYAASQGIAFLVMALVFYVGAIWIAEERYTSAKFFTALTAVLFSAMQAGNVFMFVPDASSANSGARSIFSLIDNQPEIDGDSPDGEMVPAGTIGHVRLEGIHFRYPSRPGVRVLRNLTIDVPPGKYVALVGPSGCGKSTTIQLLERFYDPQAGTVTLDGTDIRELNLASYRANFALVSQEPTLYAGTIRFNILLGAAKPMEEVTEEEIINACKDANIYDFITSLPDGFNTEVGGKGSQLSGGQKQRIAIARALIRDPKILLLDEATAALDSTSERVVQQALDNAAKGRSVVAIAHRLSTIANADIIYYVSEGQVTERGTHAELIARKGAYFELVQMQNLSKMK